MKNRTDRLLAIRDIITTQSVSSQEELLAILEERGIATTQATLSRDLKFLKASKVVDPAKGYIYVFQDKRILPPEEIAGGFAAQGFISVQFAHHLAVIKTQPGYASSIAAMIDRADPYEVLGTIAGDDTILMIPREDISDQDVINTLVLIIPDLQDKIR